MSVKCDDDVIARGYAEHMRRALVRKRQKQMKEWGDERTQGPEDE